jgi:hypothetical protein
MKPAIARALTRLYSPSWRRRYGTEFEALLRDFPFTPAVLADVLPRAIATRGDVIALLAAIVLVVMTIAGSHIGRTAAPARVAVHMQPHQASLPACRSYSSVAQKGIVARRECLD